MVLKILIGSKLSNKSIYQISIDLKSICNLKLYQKLFYIGDKQRMKEEIDLILLYSYLNIFYIW